MSEQIKHIGIIDYGMGNLTSVQNALDFLNISSTILSSPDELDRCTHCIIPGVGAFKDAMEHLIESAWIPVLNRWALEDQKPILGICLGMQLFASTSEEFGKHTGLNWIRGRVIKIQLSDVALHIPHMGWNDVQAVPDSVLYDAIPSDSDFYFVHSFHFVPDDPAVLTGTCDYGERVSASVQQGNIFAVQFHPEKSGSAGLRLLQNFCEVEC